MITSNRFIIRLGKYQKMVVAILWGIVTICSFSACTKDHEEDQPDSTYAASRTILFYMVAENSMQYQVNGDVREILVGMKSYNLSNNDRIVVYLDDTALPRIYVIDKNTEATSLSELNPVYTYEEDVNSSSPSQLATMLNNMKINYPAESYGLILWSHATGWIPSSFSGDRSSESQRRAFGLDNGQNSPSKSLNGNQMEVADIANAIESFGKLDFIFFDACFMQSMEVAYELRNSAKYVIGSPAEIPGPGANYATMVNAMFKADNYAEEMVSDYYRNYSSVNNSYGIVISSVNTSALPSFATYMKTLIANNKEALLNANYETTLNYFKYGTWRTEFPDYYDMQGIIKTVLDEEAYVQWLSEAEKVFYCKHYTSWYSSFNRMLNPIDETQCCGVSMFLPLDKYNSRSSSFNTSYLQTDWAKAVWN